MSFIKRDIKDRVVQYPRRYQLVEVQPGIFDLIPVTGTVTEEGTPVNKELLQRYEDGLDAALEKTGDGKDVTVTFSEAATEAHIASGEKLSTLFGKILKKFKNVAPKSHASSANTYGVGTTSNYGHVKTINGLTQASHVDGTALSAYQGKVLDDKINELVKVSYSETAIMTMPLNTSKTFTIPLGKIPTDIIRLDLRGAIETGDISESDFTRVTNLIINIKTSQAYFPYASSGGVVYELSNINRNLLSTSNSGQTYRLALDKIVISGTNMTVTLKTTGDLVRTYNCIYRSIVEVI